MSLDDCRIIIVITTTSQRNKNGRGRSHLERFFKWETRKARSFQGRTDYREEREGLLRENFIQQDHCSIVAVKVPEKLRFIGKKSCKPLERIIDQPKMNVLHLRSTSTEKVSELDEFDDFVAHELASLG